MARASLWSVLMVAWLSAGSGSIASSDVAISDVVVSEPAHESEAAALVDRADAANSPGSVTTLPATKGGREGAA